MTAPIAKAAGPEQGWRIPFTEPHWRPQVSGSQPNSGWYRPIGGPDRGFYRP